MNKNVKDFEIQQIDQLNLEVFGGCNLTCPMCPQGSAAGRESDFKKILQFHHNLIITQRRNGFQKG